MSTTLYLPQSCRDIAKAAYESSSEAVLVEIEKVSLSVVRGLEKVKSKPQPPKVYGIFAYADIAFAKALRSRGILDGFFAAPLSEKEMQAILASPDKAKLNDQSSLQSKIRELEQLAFTDELTSLYNRRFIKTFLERAQKQQTGFDIDFSLFLFDIDNLKSYNDKFGHTAGDELIVQTAKVMRSCFREYDILVRIGGDEFAAIMWELPREFGNCDSRQRRNKPAEAPNTEQLISRFAEQFKLSTSLCRSFTVSGAVQSFNNSGESFANVFEAADKALLKAKSSGKNKIIKLCP